MCSDAPEARWDKVKGARSSAPLARVMQGFHFPIFAFRFSAIRPPSTVYRRFRLPLSAFRLSLFLKFLLFLPMPSSPGHVFWLCGLSGAGKSTLATALAAGLRTRGTPVLALDGDALRAGLCAGLGFSTTDRAENLRRAATVARLSLDSGLCTVASFITPLEANRQMVGEIIGAAHFSLIFVDAPLAVCRQRDVKGLYARAGQGEVTQMTGMSAPFVEPCDPDLILHTAEEPASASSAKLLAFALDRLSPEQT